MVSGILKPILTGSIKALIPIKCIDQMPVPIAIEARESQKFFEKKL